MNEWVRITGKDRYYRNRSTGEVITRRQYDKLYGRLAAKGFTSNEAQAKANREARQAREDQEFPFPLSPARGRHKITIIKTLSELRTKLSSVTSYRLPKEGKDKTRKQEVEYFFQTPTTRPRAAFVVLLYRFDFELRYYDHDVEGEEDPVDVFEQFQDALVQAYVKLRKRKLRLLFQNVWKIFLEGVEDLIYRPVDVISVATMAKEVARPQYEYILTVYQSKDPEMHSILQHLFLEGVK